MIIGWIVDRDVLDKYEVRVPSSGIDITELDSDDLDRSFSLDSRPTIWFAEKQSTRWVD